MLIEFDIPRGAERSYFILFGVAAVYIATAPRGEPSLVAVSRDLGKSLTALQRRWPDMEITCAYWVRQRALAQAIATEVNRVLPHLDAARVAVRGEDAARLLVKIAVDQGISLTSHNAAMARVRDAVAEIEQRISEANRRGDLAWFNTAYREFRQRARGTGIGMSYHTARARLRNEAIKQLIVLGVNELTTDLSARIFPRSPDDASKNPVDRTPNRAPYSRALDGRVSGRHPRQILVSQYRTLPDAARRALTSSFKRERERNPNLDWIDWLSQNLQLTEAALPSLKSP